MESNRFDRLSKRFATRRTRRQALATGVGLAATGLVASRSTSAQEATPDATPVPFPSDPHPGADTAATHSEFLFVQTFDGGTWVPKPGEEGTYLLTLTGAAANTTYFSDRPERITGLAPTQAFLDGLGFGVANPPNAALVAQTANGELEVLVIELINPLYDAGTGTLTYEATILRDYGGQGLGHLARQQADFELAASFGEGSLFIDDCPDGTENCNNNCTPLGPITFGNCWDSDYWTCNPCQTNFVGTCYATFPDDCNNPRAKCVDDFYLCGSAGCCGGNCCVNYGEITCPC